MANSVTTPYGPGVVVESQTVRGREEYRVEGNDFTVWLTAAQIPEFGFMIWDETPSHEWDNSTTLPYNPTPQFPAWSNGESTVQPTHHLDPNKRTSPADSVHFSSRVADVDDNSYEDFSYESPVTDEEFPGGVNVPEDHSVPGDFALGSRRTGLNDGWELDGPGSWIKNYGDDDYTFAVIEEGDDDYSWRVEEDESGALVDDGFEADLDAAMGAADSAYQGARHGSVVDLQARLGPKYVDIPVDVDRSSLQARLDEDPVRVVADIKAANAEKIADLDPRIGQALDLELSDPELRSSAWSDVRAKASRLRRSGNVQVEAANPTSIVAVVTGDHGIYDVAVLRGSALTGSSAVTEWTCSCFPAGTPVTMADGTRKAIESVQAGDMVLTAGGNAKRVARTMNKRYVGTLYGFTTASFTGERVWSTNDHPWFVLPEARCSDCARNFHFARCDHVDRASGDFMEARDVREGMYLKLPRMISPDKDVEIDLTAFMESHREVEDGLVQAIKTTEGRFFGREGSVTRRTGRPLPHRVLVDESLAYAFGLFIGDGHFHNDDEFGFTFGGHEMMVAERLRDILTEKFGINVTIRGPKANDNTILVRAYNTTVQKVFRHFCGFGSHDKVIHESLMQAGDEVASGLTEGWKDSDGCVSVNRNLISQFRNLFTRLGVVTKVYRSKAASQHNDLAGHNGKDIWAIGYKFGNVKKSSKNFMEEDGQYSQINSIESQDFDGTVYNLEVEDDHTYVVGEYAVHNCPWGDWAFERQHTYVGRLCSHAYASLLELRAMQMRRNKGPHWSGTASRKEADRLVTQPWRLSPDLHQIPLQHDTERVDVTNTTEDGDWRTFGVSTAARMRLGLHGRKHYVQPTRWGKAVLDLLDEPGFTFHDFPGDAPSSGYMVSVNPEAEHILPEYDVTSDDLGEYMDIWGWELHDPNKFIGGWVHQGKLYLDISTWEPSLEDAALLAKAHNQIAIYDLTNDQEIMTDDALATSVGVAASKQAFMDEPYLIGPDSFGSSGDYVSEHEGPYEDLNGPEFNPVVRNGAVDEEHHARLGHLLEGNSGQGNDDIAQAAQAFLKTAGRQFTLAEQQELMDEEGLGGPIEASDLDLSGTHYL